METKIIYTKLFTLTYRESFDTYYLYYRGRKVGTYSFVELLQEEILHTVFQLTTSVRCAEVFTMLLYKWVFGQHEGFKKMLQSVYGEKI